MIDENRPFATTPPDPARTSAPTKDVPTPQPQPVALSSIPTQTPSTNAVPLSARGQNGTKSRRKRREARNHSLKPHAPQAPQQQQQQQRPALQVSKLQIVAQPQQFVSNLTPAKWRKYITAVLANLKLENLDSVSNEIIALTNQWENEKDGVKLISVIKIVFEKATNEAHRSEMYARLCRKMMEQISPNVQDDSVRDNAGKPIVGGRLFRRYLLKRCQEDFERGWSQKESAQAAAALKAADDKAAEDTSRANGEDGEPVLYSAEYYALLKAKRQGLGLVRFMGELFKLQMLAGRIMHECIQKLLSKIDNPEEEEIESLCELLTTVGQALDTPQAKGHMDIYFDRMKMLEDNPNVISRIRYMLLDVIELRQRNWEPRNAIIGPYAIAQDAAGKAAAAQPASTIVQRRGRGAPKQGPDERLIVIPTPDVPSFGVGDLSNFGKFSANSGPLYPLLRADDADADAIPKRTPSGHEITRKPSVDSDEKPAAPTKSYTEQEAKAKADEDVKEFFNIRDVSEGEKIFAEMPDEHKSKLVDKLATKALDQKESDVKLVADLFERVANKGCPASAFEDGLAEIIEFLDDTSTDVPQAYTFMARMLRGSKLSQEAVESLADNIYVDGSPLVSPKDKFLKAYATLVPTVTRSEAEAVVSLPAQAQPTATSSTADADADIGQFITKIDPDPFAINGHFGDVFKGVHRTMGVVALKRLRVGGTGNEDRAIRLCETATAIDYLHQRSLVHGDIKTSNLLISDDDHVLLCDFGLTKAESAQTSTTMKGTGTLRWQSPELWDNGPKTLKSDVYAFSMTIVEVCQLPSYPAVFKAICVEDKRPTKSPAQFNGISYENAWKVAEGFERFKGMNWEECHDFIAAIRARALVEGKQRDSAWKADFAAPLFWGKALSWHSRLPDDVREDWSKLEVALLDRWPPPDDDDVLQIQPTPAAAPSLTRDDNANRPIEDAVKPVIGGSNTNYYVKPSAPGVCASGFDSRVISSGGMRQSEVGVIDSANDVPFSPRSQHGWTRSDSPDPNALQPSQRQPSQRRAISGLEHVVPLQKYENRWVPSARSKLAIDQNSPEFAERKVKALLNKLTLENFDSVSNQIIGWANKSENGKSTPTLTSTVKLVFEKAIDEAQWSGMYARLCRKMMEQISPYVQDDTIRNFSGQPVVGGHLFRKHLVDKCQDAFERGWGQKESGQASAALEVVDNKPTEGASKASGESGDLVSDSDRYYALLKARRQGLGLVRFLAELFKVQMLTESIMHQCVKKLLGKIDNVGEEEVESVCELLTSAGQALDTPLAKGYLDIYFRRLQMLADNSNFAWKIRHMLLAAQVEVKKCDCMSLNYPQKVPACDHEANLRRLTALTILQAPSTNILLTA
ncbi:hypothetical protein FRC01_006323 [Tulasnella sp. 417]|nr:hypothetical protein FRC01_006323 [Tulasnella sp. 417]